MSQNEVWIGAAGSLGGVIIGFFLDRLSRVGKLQFYNVHVICSYSNYDREGNQIALGTSKINQATLSFGVYNSGADPKIMRNIELFGFFNKHKYRFDTRLVKGLNFLGKQQNEFNFELGPIDEKGFFSLIDFSLLESMSFELSYKNRKNKSKKIIIESVGFSEIIAH